MDSPIPYAHLPDRPAASAILLPHLNDDFGPSSQYEGHVAPQVTSLNPTREDVFEDIELDAEHSDDEENWNTLDNITALGLSFEADKSPHIIKRVHRFSMDDVDKFADSKAATGNIRPFNKWMRNLSRRGHMSLDAANDLVDSDRVLSERPVSSDSRRRHSHKKSSSTSSFGFVTAIKSASISLESFSIAPRSRRTNNSSRHQRNDRSNRTSNMARFSEDSAYCARAVVIDKAVRNRSFQRRRVLEEMIRTEESYVGDVKFLMNVYITLLASIPSLSYNLRASIHRNLNDIVVLHEELLGDLHRIVPHSEYSQLHSTAISPSLPVPKTAGHHRWRSLDVVPKAHSEEEWLHSIPGIMAEPEVAANVAKAFASKMNRFFVYEEYGAKYELMIKDVASAYRTMPQWEVYQKGLEALASSLGSINSQMDSASSKKALTVGDLLVKPIQRVCKYPLLFAELLRQTPVFDCPDSHMEIENVLIRLREATAEINRATDDPKLKLVMERTWLLQDRLVFEDMQYSRSTSCIRALGHIHLCGVLHVSWQTKTGVDGQYLISLLYRNYLLLATLTRSEMNEQIYIVQACIPLTDLRVEEVDNGRGLQCHTAPFSWKLVFESDHQLYEITMSACSSREEVEWRSRLGNSSGNDLYAGEQAEFCCLRLRIKSLGAVFGKPGTIARRISIHRATTVGPSSLCQVIIKNTNSRKENPLSSSINRSHSLMTTDRIPVLAPPRTDRIKLENVLADVWTRDIIPYPGMASRVRGEHLVRNSAQSMMRKLSVASITSNFSKRSASIASLRSPVEGYEQAKSTQTMVGGPPTQRSFDPIAQQDSFLQIIQDSAIFQDDKENFLNSKSVETLLLLPTTPTKIIETGAEHISKGKGEKTWIRDGYRIITPPLRTSSTTSVKPVRAISLSTVTDSQCAEQNSLSPLMPMPSINSSDKPPRRSKSKALGIKKGVVTGGFKNLFR